MLTEDGRKKEEGRRKKEEGRRKREEGVFQILRLLRSSERFAVLIEIQNSQLKTTRKPSPIPQFNLPSKTSILLHKLFVRLLQPEPVFLRSDGVLPTAILQSSATDRPVQPDGGT
ncbi:hypothetical protein E5S67_03045 [Microcoleus sp. IPMA8]|uniref:Uncharacterized protein n=1 Tax=Microcoleus asticus IPMA8 TaxID=2563858 RepID=A0ABX2D0Y0_9CYAN|nr:hypothetical protein [Microcoleus asticus IPMA8]